MEQKKLDRINALAKKSRETTLTAEELAEQKALRAEYLAAYRTNLRAQLEHMTIMDEQGNTRQLKKKR